MSKSVKGYLQIDIAFAIIIFFIFFMTIYTLNKDNNSTRSEIIETQELDLTARDVCTMLISSPGSPNNWETYEINETRFFGLKKQNSLSIDVSKMARFNAINYFAIREKISTNSYINIKIIGVKTNTTYLNFGPPSEGTHVKTGSYNCFSNYNSEIVTLIVEAWK